MEKSQQQKFKERLVTMLSELEQLVESSKSTTDTVVLDQSRVGRLSRMDAMQNQQMAMETERRRRNQMLQIKAALKRIEDDDFGYCLNCGEDIPIDRLEINPATTRCVACSE